MQLPPVAVVSTTSFPHYAIAKCRFVTLQLPPIPLTFPARHRQHIRRPTCLSSAEAQGNPDTVLVGKSLSIYVVHAHCLILSMSDHFVTPDASDNMHHKYGYLFEGRCTVHHFMPAIKNDPKSTFI